MQHSWVKRLRDKFKKFRSRSKELSTNDDIQRMRMRFGRKRTRESDQDPAAADDQNLEPIAKVQRVRVSKFRDNICNIYVSTDRRKADAPKIALRLGQ